MSIGSGQRRQAHLSGISGDIAQKYNYETAAVSRSFHESKLTHLTSGLLVISNTAYWVYVGQTTRDLAASFVQFYVSAVGVGTKVQELAIAHSDTAPDRAAKTITVDAVANATGDYVAAAGSFANTTSLAYTIPAGTHVWLGCRFALTSTPTQPTLNALGIDTGKGEVLSTASAGVLAVASAYTGAIIVQSTTLTTSMAPDLVLVSA